MVNLSRSLPLLATVLFTASGLVNTAAADPLVWRCADVGGKVFYTNREEATRGKDCTTVKREVSVLPSRRLAAIRPDGDADLTPPPGGGQSTTVTEGRIERIFGSGFVVSTSGDILTNDHLIKRCRSLQVHAGDQEPLKAAVVAKDNENDLAVIRMERPWGRPASLRADNPLQTGESVWVLGYPLTGLLAPELNITQGIVSATAGVRGDPKKVQITNPIQTGNSGGPLVDHSGNVVGVVAGKLNSLKLAQLTGELPQNVNFAIKLEPAVRLLSAARVAFQRSSSRDPVESVELVRGAKNYTVLIECLGQAS